MIRIGISGWRYAGWRGTFYPPGLTQKRELEYASRKLDTIELNGSFYSLQRPELYRAWYEDTPPGFLFAVKGGRFITHMKKLVDIDRPLANFFASGVLALEDKLGPFLWQLPQSFPFDEAKLAAFFAKLPRTTVEAAKLAKKHDARVTGRAHLRTKADRPLRHAIEVRHESFVTPKFLELLRRENISLVASDNPGLWPYFEELTADFAYLRLHGAEELYMSGYGTRALRGWAKKVEAWSGRGDVYVYFDNDGKVRAPFDALALVKLLARDSAKLSAAHPPPQ